MSTVLPPSPLIVRLAMILGIIYKLKKKLLLRFMMTTEIRSFFGRGVRRKPLEPNCTPVVLLSFRGHNEKYTQVRRFSWKVGRHTRSRSQQLGSNETIKAVPWERAAGLCCPGGALNGRDFTPLQFPDSSTSEFI